MTCPNCGTRSELVDIRTGNIKVHACPRCLGAWFSPTELKRRIDDSDFRPVLDAIHEQLGAAPDYSVEIQHEVRVCPHCGSGLQRGEFAVNSSVPCDRCPKGDGTWLDFLELKAIVSYMGRIAAEVPDYAHEKRGFGAWLKQVWYSLFNP